MIAVQAAAPADPTEEIRLWPGAAPGALPAAPQLRIVDRPTDGSYRDRYVEGVAEPLMTVFRPARPNGAAVLIAPGGGYVRVVMDKEGFEAARRLNADGVTAFVLRYRLPAEGWAQRQDVPLQDAQRAIRLIRSRAAEFGVDPAKVGVMGFSAGGHLAASLLTRHAAEAYPPVDAADRLPARPAFAVLVYPVISMSSPLVHAGSRTALLGSGFTAELEAAYSPERTVPQGVVPTFLVHAADDASVPVGNSVAMLAALRAAKGLGELHVFEEGGHGFGLRQAQGKPAAAWPDLLVRWMTAGGFIPRPPSL